MLKEFIIENVRCFKERQRVPIRPITLLVGEDSVGKTTLLGCYRALFGLGELVSSEAHGKIFNNPPFHMGAFRDIVARSRPAANKFALGAGFREAGRAQDLVFSFTEKGAEPSLSEVASFIDQGAETFDDELHILRKDNAMEISGTGFANRPIREPLPPSPPPLHLLRLNAPRKFNSDQAALFFRHFPDDTYYRRARDPAPRRSVAESGNLKNNIETLTSTQVSAVAPARAEPKRTYDPVSEAYSPQGDHAPMLMARLFRTAPKKWQQLHAQLVAFGKASHLFSDIDIRELGKHVSDPFQIQVKARRIKTNIMDAGYGISQILPLLVDIMRAKRRTFLLQQPEEHLYPQAQAALANLFAAMTKSHRHSFLIETHSDFIVDRMRVCIHKGEINAKDVAILYFEPDKRTGHVKIHHIKLDKEGQICNPPFGYRQFFLDETDRVLGFSD